MHLYFFTFLSNETFPLHNNTAMNPPNAIRRTYMVLASNGKRNRNADIYTTPNKEPTKVLSIPIEVLRNK